MAEVTLTLEEYEALREMAMGSTPATAPAPEQAPKKRKVSAYSKKFGKTFKQIAPRYKLKNGKWKKNGFKLAVRAAHKLLKK